MASISEIEGIGPVYAEKLKAAGITTTDALLEQGKTPKGRAEIAQKTGITEKRMLEWVNHIDLMRIKGVGSEYADLLEAAGVDTIPEMAQRKADNLLEKLTAINAEKNIVRRLPLASQVEEWIEQAKQLPRLISY